MRQWLAAVIVGVAAGSAFGQGGARLVPLTADATVAQRAAFYSGVAGSNTTATLDELVSRVADLPPSETRRFQLEAIVERYVELDVERAARISGDLLRAEAQNLVVRIYERLGRTDVNAALEALSQIDDPIEERLAAGALLEAFGGDLRALDLVSAALHGIDAEQFRASGLVRLGRESPREAFAAALALRDPELRSTTAASILAGWVAEAPDSAIEALRQVEDPALGTALRNVMLGGLRTADSIVAYLDTLDAAERQQALAAGILARLAQLDPVVAAELVAGLPQGPQRRQLEAQVGMAYARKDPAASLAWARSLPGDNAELVLAVVRGIAFTDSLQALDLADSLDEPARSQGVLTAVGMGGNDKPFAALAARILQMPEDTTRAAAITALLNGWAMGPNVSRAVDWAIANASAVPPESFERLAYQVVQADPAAAVAYLERVPSAARAGWLSAVVVSTAAGDDPQAALSLIERYRGDPSFDRAATALVPLLARTDPPAAVRLLGSINERSDGGFNAEFQIANAWAQRDPAAAAAWAIELAPLRRNAIVTLVTGAWASADREAVRRWALTMPPSEKRDAALAAAVRSLGTEPDPALLGAFSDDRARQTAMMPVVMNAAMTDRAAARRLLEAHISDPRMRAQAEEMIETMPRGMTPSPSMGFGMPGGIRNPVTGTVVNGVPMMLPPGMTPAGVRPGGVPPLVAPNGGVFVPGPRGSALPGQAELPALLPAPPTEPRR